MPHLTPTQREAMQTRYAAGTPTSQLANDYGCDIKTVMKHCKAGGYSNTFKVECEDRQLSYRENLQWAIEKAGRFRRSSERPDTCPNDTAWFLYTQALEEPKDFMAKVAAMEKGAEDDTDKDIKRNAKFLLHEIDSFLNKLGEEDGKA